MATEKIRYFMARTDRRGRVRHVWQPSKELRAVGWTFRRLSDDRLEAVAEAERLNAEVDAWRATEGAPARGPADGTVDALINAYRASHEAAGKAPATRRFYEHNFQWISEVFGDVDVRRLTTKTVVEFYEGMFAATPTKAAAAIRTLRMLLEYGRRRGWLEVNPARRVKIIGAKPSGRLWSRTAVDHFVATAEAMGRPSIADAVILNEWLGQREGDVLALSWSAYRDGAITIDQAKTGAKVELPVDLVPHLKARLAAIRKRQRASGVLSTTIVASETTLRPYRADDFRHVFAEVRAKAIAGDATLGIAPMPELEGLWFMHLRHTAVTRLAEANCADAVIAAVTGHTLASVASILARYLVRTGDLARVAFERRREGEGTG